MQCLPRPTRFARRIFFRPRWEPVRRLQSNPSAQDALSHSKRLQMRMFGFSQKEPGVLLWQERNVILFLLWCSFPVPSLKNTAPIFLEIFLIQCFAVELFMTSSLSSFG